MESAKIGFFKRIKKSIFNFDEYEKFIIEKPKKAFGYIFKLIAIFAIIITIAGMYALNNYKKDFVRILQTEFPDFKIENNTLDIDGTDKVERYFENINLQVIMSDEETNIDSDYENSLVMLKDKIIVKYLGITENIEYEEINNFSKQNIINFFETRDWTITFLSISVILFISNFIFYMIMLSLDILTLSILGLIINIFIRTSFKYVDILKIAIYSMTLPIILYLGYNIVNILFGITIKYFAIAYNTISYIYLITAMLIMKSDIIKNTQELQMILQEQQKVKEEIAKDKEKEKEEQKEREKDKDKDKKEGEKKGKNKTPSDPQADNA